MSKETKPFIKVSFKNTSLNDVFMLSKFEGKEEFSDLFHYTLVLHSSKKDIDLRAFVGEELTIMIVDENSKPVSQVHGFIREIAVAIHALAHDKEKGSPLLIAYEAQFVPQLWKMTQATDLRIFQNMNVLDIIKKVFEKHGLSPDKDFKIKTQQTYQVMEYCVQYRETSWNFIRRLMEKEGLYAYFDHTPTSSAFVIVDNIISQPEYKGEPIEFKTYDPEQGEVNTEPSMWMWQSVGRYFVSDFEWRDFNFKKAPASILDTGNHEAKPYKSLFARYEYPGGFTEKPHASHLLKMGQEEQDAQSEIFVGETNVILKVGEKFKLSKVPRPDFNGEFQVIATDKTATVLQEDKTEQFQGGFSNTIVCMRVSRQYRTPKKTNKPLVHGIQTAIVVGEPGSEIYPDIYGRVKVQFHWDREGKKDEKSSCWVRVAQFGMAGPGFGTFFLPRLGMEVVVDFVDGDPDRPLIVGSVYNGQNRPPYDQPNSGQEQNAQSAGDFRTRSGIKTRSSLSGSPDNFNELRFEDKKGKEHVYLQAEKDWYTKVKNDRNTLIQNIDNMVVEGNVQKHFQKNYDLMVDGMVNVDYGASEQKHVVGPQSEKVDAPASKMYGTTYTETVVGAYLVQYGSSFKSVLAADFTTVAGPVVITSGTGVFINAPTFCLNIMGESAMQSPSRMSMGSDKEFVLKVGQSQICLKPDEISIYSPKITINGWDGSSITSMVRMMGGNLEIMGNSSVRINDPNTRPDPVSGDSNPLGAIFSGLATPMQIPPTPVLPTEITPPTKAEYKDPDEQ